MSGFVVDGCFLDFHKSSRASNGIFPWFNPVSSFYCLNGLVYQCLARQDKQKIHTCQNLAAVIIAHLI